MADFIERETILHKLRGDCLAHYPSYCIMGILSAANEVANIPAADVRPVVRGKWTKSEYDGSLHVLYMCSQCGSPIGCDKGTPRENGLNFCPNCGAMMEGNE